MKARAVFLASLAAMFSASTVHAEDCELRPSNLDAFAKHRLGRLRSIPSDLKQLSRCVDGAKMIVVHARNQCPSGLEKLCGRLETKAENP